MASLLLPVRTLVPLHYSPFTPPLYHSFLPLHLPIFFLPVLLLPARQDKLRDAETGLLLEYSNYRHLLISLLPFFKKKNKNKCQDKLRDPETGLLLEYSNYGTSSPASRNNHARIGRLPLILAGIYIQYKSHFDLYDM